MLITIITSVIKISLYRYYRTSLLVRYSCITNSINYIGRAGWGISWYINGTLIPELVVERGRTYTFIIEGGNDSTDLSNYHPFYITDSISGGRLQNTEEERAVSLPSKELALCILILNMLYEVSSYLTINCLYYNSYTTTNEYVIIKHNYNNYIHLLE